MIDELVDRARGLMARHGGCIAAGAAVGGPIDVERGVVLGPPNLPGWDDVPLAERLRDALGLPVAIQHDAAACALAEYRWGRGGPAARLIYLTCGTGFGAGILIDGRPYYGVRGRAPELGHVRYREDGPEAFGKRGCFEAYAAGSSLARLAAWRFPERWGSGAPAPPELAGLAERGDPEAAEILRLNAAAVGHACALLIDLYAPARVLLGSLSRYLPRAWLEAVRAACAGEALAAPLADCRIEPASLGDRLQDLAALATALEQEEENGGRLWRPKPNSS
jgi:glucokinase